MARLGVKTIGQGHLGWSGLTCSPELPSVKVSLLFRLRCSILWLTRLEIFRVSLPCTLRATPGPKRIPQFMQIRELTNETFVSKISYGEGGTRANWIQ